ncbi:MAG: HYR domain-containing protein [Pyrinomonadaceae bacterium]
MNSSAAPRYRRVFNCSILIAVLVLAIAVLAVPLFSAQSGSVGANKSSDRQTKRVDFASRNTPWSSRWPAGFMASLSLDIPTIATYEDGCTTLQDSFTLTDTICAKANSDFTGTRYIHFVDSQGGVVQTSPITSTNPSADYVSTEAGTFRVYLSDGDGLIAKSDFTVSDPENPKVDLYVFKYNRDGDVTSGNPTSYQIVVVNNGPDAASSVVLTDAVPANLTYVSSGQDSGPTFTEDGTTPTTTWSIASLPAGTEARFTITYTVSGAAGTVISNTATITTTTEETHPEDNSSTTFDTVSSGGGTQECSLDCPNDIVTTATVHGENGGANVTFTAPEGSGTCGAITSNPASGSFFPVGTTTVTSTSATGGGFCTFTVTVVDSDAPTITCPSNITVTANEGQGQAFVPDPDGSSSSVGSPTTTGDAPLEVTGSREDGEALISSYPLGTTEITWIATDPAGRQATCTQLITVAPETVLTITCPANVTVSSPSGCDPATANPGTPTTNSETATVLGRRSDNLAYSNTAEFNDPYPIGTTTIEWTATDTDTQSASCNQTVTVTGDDTTPPTLNVPPSITTSTSECSVLIDEENFNATAEDDGACGSTVNISRTGIPRVPCPAPGDPGRTCESFVFPTGTTVVTYTATDASGNSTSGTQTVTVNENPNQPPTITAPDDLTVNTGPGATSCGVFVGDATLGTATANDNCPGFVVTRTGVPAGNNFPVGTTTITYRVTDRVGNFTEDTQTVTVIDNTPPVISCPANITQNTDPGVCSATVNVGTATATDNCDSNPTIVGTRSDSQPLNAPYPKGTTTITWTATDHASPTPNQSSCVQTITVEDNEAPVITTTGLTPILWPANHAYHTFNVATFVIGASDNCDSLSVSDVTIQKVTSDETEEGGGDGNTLNDIIIAADCKSFQVRAERRNSADGRVYTVTFQVTDSEGNVGTKTSKIHVPKNLGVPVVDSGPNYTVNSTCILP